MGHWMRSWTAKVLGLGLLALLMLIPLYKVQSLVEERQDMRQSAVQQIAQGWGGEQVLGGLVLAVPTREQVSDAQGVARVHGDTVMVLPDTASIDAAMLVEKRRYGIYEAPVFSTSVQLRGRFLPEEIAQLRQLDSASWQTDKAELRLVVADLRGLQEVSELLVNGKPQRFSSSAASFGGRWATVTVPLDLTALDGQPIDFAIRLQLAGTQSLQLLPLARTVDARLRAPWPDPSFTGAALPVERRVDAQGFSARWHMLDLNRSFGQSWHASDERVEEAVRNSSFGVALYQPVDLYQRNVRAGKYGLLFVTLTFVAFFLFEVLKRMRVHPVQYLLVGAALSAFYVLLLALSEQIGFAPAYVVASLSVVVIIGGYAAAVLRARRAGLLLGGTLALVYAMLYVVLAAEAYALLIGAVVLVLTLALLMYLTRRIDWYASVPAAVESAAVIMERP
ncbi:cell envelope integrity protein CreD [Dyella solisilvae]|uniref:Cell envelope integrity protein CreD n=1 Tax=Dyella solisilvae TaxID=1920168 RepID=A0A370K4R3_9GAMM|nr:cell envelope integrity protein CreD [Dyella solisilvae]RDI97645.1 cell envelope integrity protein CreD [Dyella solisilvae]